MSALAHWFEQNGLTTVVIGLIRLHLEKMRPPRALWVSFELGRPIGPPQQPDFQRDVLRQALALIERDDGPGLIIDYALDDPNAVADPGWQPPLPSTSDATSVLSELQLLQDAYIQAKRRFGRSSVGVAKMDIEQSARVVDSFISGEPMTRIRDDVSDTLSLRLALDDIRTYYTEAGTSVGSPTSRQLHEWFWYATYAGQQINALKQRFLVEDDVKLKSLAGKFIVPRAFAQGFS